MVKPEQPVSRNRLQRWPHAPADGIPFFDEELQVAHNKDHRIMVYQTGSILEIIAREAGLQFLSDECIWYLDPKDDQQKVFYGDWVLAKDDAPVDRITAEDLVMVAEIVSTNDKRKERKDTIFQRALNQYNRVPEFVLVFPDLKDERSLTYCRLVDGVYREQVLVPGASVDIQGVPGLQFRVRPQAEWERGRKLDIWYRGTHRLLHDVAVARTAAAEIKIEAIEQNLRAEQVRADAAQARANAEQVRADAAEARLARMAEKLRDLGFDPND